MTARDRGSLAVIALATVAVYGRVVGDELIPEDIFLLNEGSDFLRYLAGGDGAVPVNYFRPGAWAFVGALHALFGTWAAPYYVLGLVLHAAYAGVFYLFLRRAGGVPPLAALLAALLVLASPAHANVVFWVSAHKYLVALTCLVVSLWLLIAEPPRPRRTALGVVVFALGLSLHASLIVAIPALLVAPAPRRPAWLARAVRVAPAAALVAGLAAVEVARGAVERFNAGPLQVAKNVVSYAALPYYPFGGAGLTERLGDGASVGRLVGAVAETPAVLAEVLLAVATVALVVAALVRGSALARLGAAIFLGGLALYMPYKAVSSRFSTAAALGLAMIAAAGLAAVERRPRPRVAAHALAAVLVVALGAVSAARLSAYRVVTEPFRAVRAAVAGAPPGATVVLCGLEERVVEDTRLVMWMRSTAPQWVPSGVTFQVDPGPCAGGARPPAARVLRFVPPATIVHDP